MSVYKQLIIRYIHGLSIELNIQHEKLLYSNNNFLFETGLTGDSITCKDMSHDYVYTITEIKSVTESINLNISTKKDDFDG